MCSYSDGFGTFASFPAPFGLTVGTDRYIYVSDWGNNRIRQIYPSCKYICFFVSVYTLITSPFYFGTLLDLVTTFAGSGAGVVKVWRPAS